jgi:SAM-dependent methyltransferase
MKETTKIKDYGSYNKRMNKSMLDKVFFLDKINVVDLLDYGCGDGSLLRFIRSLTNNYDKTNRCYEMNLMGFDSDPRMIEMAKRDDKRIQFYNDWQNVELYRGSMANSSALILSSVIHEIYHYSTAQQINEFWDRVFSHGFTYIAIRDMIPSRTISRPSDINDIAKVYKRFLNKQELYDFETIWGPIDNNKNLVHFLLKYRYLEPNWHREVRENYMPIYREDLLARLDTSHYEIVYHEHYILPYIKQYVQADLGIELKDCTHLKLILKEK